jgi:hypothetical protein
LLRRGTESPRRREAIDRRQHLAAKARTGEIVSERLAHPAMSSAGFIGTVMLLQAFARGRLQRSQAAGQDNSSHRRQFIGLPDGVQPDR